MIVDRYRDDQATAWNAFVRNSRHGLFLFERGYMDYHRDRFTDHSLIVRDGPEIVALLPAHEQDRRLISHGGLSYGGLITGPEIKLPGVLHAFEAIMTYARDNAFESIDYKAIPSIYSAVPADEDRYALFLLGAKLTRRDVLSVVAREQPLPFQNRRERSIRRGIGAGITVVEEQSLAEFWALLGETLQERFGATPVHTLAEMELLRERFPRNIRLFSARGAAMLAGTLVFESGRVAHCQYIASSPEGRAAGALDVLFDHLLRRELAHKPYFDFGSSHEMAGRKVNQGLIDQKEGFGARSVACEQHRIDVSTFVPGTLTGALR